MVSHIHYNINANEDFVIFLLPSWLHALLTFIYMLSVSLDEWNPGQFLMRGSEHVYSLLGLQGEVHSIWDLWTSGLQECKGDFLKKIKNWVGQASIVSHDQSKNKNWWGCLGVLDCGPWPWEPPYSTMGSWFIRLEPIQMAWALAPTQSLLCWMDERYAHIRYFLLSFKPCRV